jgi:tyrosyl-tRNA synthetase
MPSSDFLREATERGFVHQCTDTAALDAALRAGPVGGYIGFDCTADSLHVGSLVQIMLLRLMQRHGHRPVVLMGGGTTRIGDPSGKDESRQLLNDAQIAHNMRGIRRVFDPFLAFGDRAPAALLANNADWLDALGYIPLLREVGTHFTVNRMLTFDSVRLRLEREQPLTFLEFNYMILQAYDFRELYRRHGVTLQLGGSDQWGNIVSGIELVRRTEGVTVFGLTTPLLTTASGAKMGKTAQGAVWLTADRVGPYEYWQFWRNTEDADVGRFLRLFTDLPLAEIGRLEALGGAEINAAKKTLATEATALAHGREAAELAAETARAAFEQGEAAATLPSVTVTAAALAEGIPAFALLMQAGLAASGGEARRLIRQGGARLNDEPLADEALPITAAHLRGGAIKLSKGRKQHVLVRATPT